MTATATACTLFDTPIGTCGIVWSEAGIVGVQLPENTPRRLDERLARRFPAAARREPSPEVAAAMAAICRLLGGARESLEQVVLDLQAEPEFHRQVYALTRAIPPGHTTTYGELARQLGDPQLSRAVGQALGRNPCPIIVPCHRVLAASGAMHGFSAPGGIDTKHRLLLIEGAPAAAQLPLFGAGAAGSA